MKTKTRKSLKTKTRKPLKTKTRKPRCKLVLAILGNEMKTLELLREETYPLFGDFTDESSSYAVCRVLGAGSYDEVYIPIQCVIFLK